MNNIDILNIGAGFPLGGASQWAFYSPNENNPCIPLGKGVNEGSFTAYLFLFLFLFLFYFILTVTNLYQISLQDLSLDPLIFNLVQKVQAYVGSKVVIVPLSVCAGMVSERASYPGFYFI